MPIIAWQGWQFEAPPRWNPVKIEGNFDAGSIVLADLRDKRMAMTWTKPRKAKKFEPMAAVRKIMLDEVGMLAAGEAVAWPASESYWQCPLLYTEPDPPGRDVWVAFSQRSGRLIELIYHTQRREHLLPTRLLPSLGDQAGEDERRWAVFELSCRVDANLPLESQRLNAGDLGLTFANGRKSVMVRQVAVASLALQRQPIEKWLSSQLWARKKHYRLAGEPVAMKMESCGRELRGFLAPLRRRRRFVLMRSLAPSLTICALHDPARDRLVIVEASDEQLLRRTSATVGWAVAPGNGDDADAQAGWSQEKNAGAL